MDLPEACFAIIASYLPDNDPAIHFIRKLAGSVKYIYVDVHGYSRNNGFLHSIDDKPAVIKNALRIWYYDGKVHRENDLPAVINENSAYWFHKGKLHRKTAPAIIKENIEIYYEYGKRIRKSQSDTRALESEKSTCTFHAFSIQN